MLHFPLDIKIGTQEKQKSVEFKQENKTMPGRPGGRFGRAYAANLNEKELNNYVEYLKGNNKHTVERTLKPSERARVALSIIPFGKALTGNVTTDNYYRVTATVQAIKLAKLIQTNLAVFGIQAEPPDTHTTKGGFYPALVRPAVREPNSEKTNKTSSFSGKPYKSYNTRSGSIPFGRSSANPEQSDYEEQKQLIATTWGSLETTAVTKVSISFEPEYWDKVTETVKSAASAVSGNIDFTT